MLIVGMIENLDFALPFGRESTQESSQTQSVMTANRPHLKPPRRFYV
jgi:hypothetical protein